MPARPAKSPVVSRSLVLGAFILVIAALSLARNVIIPITLATLLAFLLNPLVSRLRRWGLPHAVSVVLLGGASLTMLVLIGTVLTVQIASLAEGFPGYREAILQKVNRFLEPLLRMAGAALNSVNSLAPATSTSPAASMPSTLHVVNEPNRGAVLLGLLQFVASPIGTIAIVPVLAGAMLMQGSDLRDRVMRLFGVGRIPITSEALDDASDRVSRYLLVQTMLNGSQGIVVAIVLMLIGLPGSLLWGLLWAILRFIPFLGSWIGASLPLLLSLGYFSGWVQPVLICALFIIVELLCNFVFEPWLYGSKTGLSPLAILVSAMFWTWLWGGVGLLLAIPMSTCLAVLGCYVKPLEFLNILLGDKPVLRPSVRLYRRLLTNEADDARKLVLEELKARSYVEVFEEVVIPALVLIDAEAQRGRVEAQRLSEIQDEVFRIITEVESTVPIAQPRAVPAQAGPCLCIPARDRLDNLCGQMLRVVLAERGFSLTVAESGYLANEKAALVAAESPSAVIVSALAPAREQFLRHTLMRIDMTGSDVHLIAGLWAYNDETDETIDRLERHVDAIYVTSFAQALEAVRYATQLADQNTPPRPRRSALSQQSLPADRIEPSRHGRQTSPRPS